MFLSVYRYLGDLFYLDDLQAWQFSVLNLHFTDPLFTLSYSNDYLYQMTDFTS